MASKKEEKGMPKWIIPTIVIVLVVLAIFGWVAGTYNGLVSADVDVDTKWGQVVVVYQERAALGNRADVGQPGSGKA